MGVFFSDWCGPKQVIVDPRGTIRMTWLYYIDDEATDDPLQYFKISWKLATVKGWTDPSVKTAFVNPTVRFYELAPNSFTLDSVWTYKVEAWVIDRDYDPNVPPGTGVPTADPFVQSRVEFALDTSGYELWAERNTTVASGAQGFSIIAQKVIGFFTLSPSDPGEYEVRFRVSNGFQWSAYSTPVKLVMYDTRRWVKKSGIWNAVPAWTKKVGGFVRTRT